MVVIICNFVILSSNLYFWSKLLTVVVVLLAKWNSIERLEAVYNYHKLNSEQNSFIIKKLIYVSGLFKKWAPFTPKSERSDFRWNILSGNPDATNIPFEKIDEFLKDANEIKNIRNQKFAELDQRTIELSVIEGYIPLLTEWSNNNEDLLQELIIRSIFAIYYFNDENKKIISYLKKAAIRQKNRFHQNNRLIQIPNHHFSLQRAIEQQINENQNMTVEEICQKLKITPRKMKTLQNTKLIANISCNTEKLLAVESSQEVESDDRKITIQQIADSSLNDLQKKALIASLSGSRGWKTRLAQETINHKTKKPYSKMAITIAYNTAVEALKKELANE